MVFTKFLDFNCIPLENSTLSLLVTQSVGPRVISLRYNGGDNMFAEMPDFVTERPDGGIFHFYGGHRLWVAPENMPLTYAQDDGPVDIVRTPNSILATQPVDTMTGLQKSIFLTLTEDKPQVIVQHTLKNTGVSPVICAPWAITQLKTGGVAILPQSSQPSEFLANRTLAFWSYTVIANPQVSWGNQYILIHAEMKHGAFKVGFPNPRGWMAYWNAGTLFVVRAVFDPQAEYFDFNSSSECYCNDRFLELETLAPVSTLKSGEFVTHSQTWELYPDVECPVDESTVQLLVEKLGLE